MERRGSHHDGKIVATTEVFNGSRRCEGIDHLSEYLRRAHSGERIVITDRGKPLAVLSPVEEPEDEKFAWELVRMGKASWSGGKPKGAQPPVVLKGKGKTAAEMILEDRQ